VPAAAVIPAPIAYIKVVAVKKLVVGSRASACSALHCDYYLSDPNSPVHRLCPLLGVYGSRYVYFEKIRVLKAGLTPE
jgi:hypothetical protein